MLNTMKKDGFHVCLWQLPYFTPKNRFFKEIVDNGMEVKMLLAVCLMRCRARLLNPATVKWYQDKISGLIKQGVSVIKLRFR